MINKNDILAVIKPYVLGWIAEGIGIAEGRGSTLSSFLIPLTWYDTKALWLNKRAIGGTAYGMAEMADGKHLAMNGSDSGGIIQIGGGANPWYSACELMNGTNRYWSRAVDGYICPTNWFTFGMWFYINSIPASGGGVMKWGTTTCNLSVYLYADSAGHPTTLLPGFEIYGTDGARKFIDTTWVGVGWHFIGGRFGFTSTSSWVFDCWMDGNHYTPYSTTPTSALRAASGNLAMGMGGVNAGSVYLNGTIATAWISGYNDNFITKYFQSTYKLFWS